MISMGLGRSISLVGFCIVAEVARELAFKRATDRAGDSKNVALALAREPLIWIGILLWLVETIAWLVVLQHVPLSIAFPAMMLVYASIPAAGALFLGERLSRTQLIGVGFVVVGVGCVSLSDLQA